MKYLPFELEFNILSWAPAESLSRWRCVSKSWLALIDDPSFREIHTDRLLNHLNNKNPSSNSVNMNLFLKFHIQTYNRKWKQSTHNNFQFAEFRNEEEAEFDADVVDEFSRCYKVSKPITLPPGYGMKRFLLYLSSCNGLICLFKRNPVIFNPITEECMYLPVFKRQYMDSVWGFGYHPVSKEYKVVRMFRTSFVHYVCVFTVGKSSKWRIAGNVPSFQHCESNDLRGVLVNGALHWFDINGYIQAFDLLTEKFQHIQSPPRRIHEMGQSVHHSLGVLGNRLCVIRIKSYEYIQIWMLKNNESSSEWVKEFNIPIAGENMLSEDSIKYCKLLRVTESGKVLLCFRKFMVFYDPKKEKLSIHKNEWPVDAVPHMSSFISLKDFKKFEQVQFSETTIEEHNEEALSTMLGLGAYA